MRTSTDWRMMFSLANTAFLYCASAFFVLTIVTLILFVINTQLGIWRLTFVEKAFAWATALMALSTLIFAALSIIAIIFHLG